jgi:hypothetical protein
MVPAFIIILLFLASFLLTLLQYARIDPKRRVLNLRFALMVCALAAALGYPLYVFHYPDDRPTSRWFLILGLSWLAISFALLRRMPARENY